MIATQMAVVTTDQASKAVAEFLSVLETKQIDNLLTIWDENGIFELPFSHNFSHKAVPGLHHPKFEGRQRIYELFQGVGAAKDFEFQDIAFYPMVDAEWVFVEFLGNVKQLDMGIKYINQYCALARVRQGKMLLFR